MNPQTGPFFVEGAEPGNTLALHFVAMGELDRTANTVPFAGSTATCRSPCPVAPMLGTVGVAPPGREVRSSLVPERFGGNMDTPRMRPGTRAPWA